MQLSLTQSLYTIVEAIYHGLDDGFDYLKGDIEKAFEKCNSALNWQSLQVTLLDENRTVLEELISAPTHVKGDIEKYYFRRGDLQIDLTYISNDDMADFQALALFEHWLQNFSCGAAPDLSLALEKLIDRHQAAFCMDSLGGIYFLNDGAKLVADHDDITVIELDNMASQLDLLHKLHNQRYSTHFCTLNSHEFARIEPVFDGELFVVDILTAKQVSVVC